MSAGDGGADIRTMKALQEKVAELQEHVDALIAANLGREALVTDGRERLADLKGIVSALSGRVRDLESPPDAGAGLTDAMAKLPAYAARLTQAEVAAEKESGQ